MPEDEQVALVERLLRRAIASDASSRGVRAELPAATVPRRRTEAESGAADVPAPRGAAPLASRTAAPGSAAADSAEPTSELDAQDGWGDGAQSTAPPLALELEKLLPSAQMRPPPASAPSPLPSPSAAAGTRPTAIPADAPATRGQSAFAVLSGADLPLAPLAAAAAAGTAVALGAAAVWLGRGREADAAQPQAAPSSSDRPVVPPEAAVRAAASEGVDVATTARRPGVLWARKETPGGAEAVPDADGAAPSVLWTRGARQNKSGATDDAPAGVSERAELPDVAELSDNAEGLRFGARLKQPPQ